MDDDVRIEEDQNIAVRQSGSAIPRHGRAVGTPGQRDELDAEAMCQRRCPVGRSVIDDQNLVRFSGGERQRGEGTLQVALAVVDRHNHGNLHPISPDYQL